jgi:hypothetical protein
VGPRQPIFADVKTACATSDIVTIYVGKKRKAYKVHKELLISKCPYFRGCLSDAFPEGRSNEVFLKEDVPGAFDCLVRWLNPGSVSPVVTFKDVCTAFHNYVMADALLTVE